MMTREERIEARANELSKADGQPGSHDRKYWSQAATLIDEEEARLAKETVDPAGDTGPSAEPRASWPTNDPIGVTIAAARRQG